MRLDSDIASADEEEIEISHCLLDRCFQRRRRLRIFRAHDPPQVGRAEMRLSADPEALPAFGIGGGIWAKAIIAIFDEIEDAKPL